MSQVVHYCPVCKKKSEFADESKISNLIMKRYSCGHFESRQLISADTFLNQKSEDDKQMYKFQAEGAAFAYNSGCRFLILDEMGLGKTNQAARVMQKLGKRTLWLCKSSLKIQTLREIYRWTGLVAQIIEFENDFIIPGTRVFILSYDLMTKAEFVNKQGTTIKRGFQDLEGFVRKLKIEFLVADEVQHIKNADSSRTANVQKLASLVPYVGFLSGTAVENHAGEFFPILNMIRPDKFPSKSQYERVWVDTYFNGRTMKYGGLKDPAAFYKYTSDFIIRRTRASVLPDLPVCSRENRFSELGGKVEEAYKKEMKQLLDYMNNGCVGETNFKRMQCILAYMNKMWHLTGIAKVNPITEFLTEFVDTTDRKIVVFVHHKDVAAALHDKIKDLCGVAVAYGKEGWDRQDEIDRFKDDPNCRILVASLLASSEGLNLQFCHDCIIGERYWNPSKEQQAESRFIRIGQTSDKVSATYFIAVGTIDEFFAELVEKKRAIVDNTLDGKVYDWHESSLIEELAEVLRMNGGRKWNL
jgi:SWI/SNF-related matrix-associated actin-dependent regulator 1 of chromatin subfamily A